MTTQFRLALLASTLSLIALPAFAQAPTAAENSETADDGVIELSLEDAIRIANERSFRTGRSRRNYETTQLRYQNARSGYYPRADLRANADQSARGFQYDSDRFDFSQPIRGEFRGGLTGNVYLPIDVGGVIARQVSQAGLARELSGNDMTQTTLDVTQEIQSHYLNALRAQNQVEADARVVEELRALLTRGRSSAQGVAPFLEVELGNAQQTLTNSRTNADQAQDGLKQALRAPPETRLRLTTRLEERTETFARGELLERALQGRPEVRSALLRIRQAELAARQVNDHRLPTVSFGGFYNDSVSARTVRLGDHDRFRNRGVGLNLSVPIGQYDHGQLSRTRRIALIQQQQATADAEEVQERVGYEVRQALLAVERAESRIRNLPDPDQAYQAMKRAEQQMLTAPEGQAQSLLAQVSNARNAWRAAEVASSDAYIDYNQAVFRLRRTLGERHEVREDAEAGGTVPLPLASVGAVR